MYFFDCTLCVELRKYGIWARNKTWIIIIIDGFYLIFRATLFWYFPNYYNFKKNSFRVIEHDESCCLISQVVTHPRRSNLRTGLTPIQNAILINYWLCFVYKTRITYKNQKITILVEKLSFSYHNYFHRVFFLKLCELSTYVIGIWYLS